MKHGFLLVDKPKDISSHDAVAIVRRTLGERSVGHLGTLDPMATGLLVMAIGKKALKVVELFSDLRKEYLADVAFGAISSTYDAEGVLEEIPAKAGWQVPSEIEVRNVITDRFIGKVRQIPPAFSAVHVDGVRAYKRAARGEEVKLDAREVEIDACDIVKYEFPLLTLKVSCSSGTYIRSLAHDLGQVLHSSAFLSALRRTKVGEFSVDDAKAPDAISWFEVKPLKDVLQDFARIDLSADEWEEIKVGRTIDRGVKENTLAWFDELPVALMKPLEEGMCRARKVL
jgi:tRNA pseudouridine55 synthase